MYGGLAPWFHLLTPPAEYDGEAAFALALLRDHVHGPLNTLLELGSGGGNLASHLKRDLTLTLTDVAPDMLELSRTINPEVEHLLDRTNATASESRLAQDLGIRLFPGPLRDELTALALAGTKTTRAGLLVDFEAERAALPTPGNRELLIRRRGGVRERRRVSRVARTVLEQPRRRPSRRARRPGFSVEDDTMIVLERFKIVERLD